MWNVANSKICTKAVDKTLKIFINESKSVKIHEKSQISRKDGNGRFSRKKANFTENVTVVKLWIRLVPSHVGFQLYTHPGLPTPDQNVDCGPGWPTQGHSCTMLSWCNSSLVLMALKFHSAVRLQRIPLNLSSYLRNYLKACAERSCQVIWSDVEFYVGSMLM